MRILLKVNVPNGLVGARDLPITRSIDLSKELRNARPSPYPTDPSGKLEGFELNVDSFKLVEVDATSFQPISTTASGATVATPATWSLGSFDHSTTYDARINPLITFRWVLEGQTTQDRYYFLYFDAQHNGDKTPTAIPPSKAGKIAASLGPGRGTRVYVPLHDHLGLADVTDPRSVRITNLQGEEVHVQVFHYTRFGLPAETPVEPDFTIGAGVGTMRTYTYPADYQQGAILLVASGLVMAEASSRVTSTLFNPGSSRAFLPSVDGGYIGRDFAETTASGGMRWLAFCPSHLVPAPSTACRATFGGAAPVEIPANNYWEFHARAGQVSRLRTEIGAVAVQRLPEGTGSDAQRAITLWPPLDGPAASTVFMGDTRSQDGKSKDRLILVSAEPSTRITAKSLTGSRDVLADELDLRTPGLFTEPDVPQGWATTWDRPWRLKADFQARPQHSDGPARISGQAGGPLTIANGFVGSSTPFSALVPLQSPDGGLTYQFVIPKGLDGIPLGQLSVFAPFQGTNVIATGHDLMGGGAPRFLRRESLLADQYLPEFITEPGWWTIRADRPILVSWFRQGDEAYGAFAPAITDKLTAEVVLAQFSGYMFQVTPRDAFKTVRPGNAVAFKVDVKNLARTVTGGKVPDTIEFHAAVPPGWPRADVIPGMLRLGGGVSDSVTVSVSIPSDVDVTAGGASMILTASSAGEPRLNVQTSLRINYQTHRGVLVTADDLTVEASKSLAIGETVSYVLRIANTGSVRDTFDVEFSNPGPAWMVEVQCLDGPNAGSTCGADGRWQTDELKPQGTASYLVTVAPSADGPSSTRLVTQFLAASLSDPSVTGAVRMITSVSSDRSFRIEVTDPTRVVLPGEATEFRLTVFNEADLDEELKLEVSPLLPEGWESPDVRVKLDGLHDPVLLEELNGTVPIRAHSAVDILIDQRVPPREAPRGLALTKVSMQSALTAVDGARATDLRVIVGTAHGFLATVDGSRLSTIPGAVVPIGLSLQSQGNANQSIILTPHIVGNGTGWGFYALGRAPPWTVEIPPYSNHSMKFELHVPSDAQGTALNPVVLTLRGTAQGNTATILRLYVEVALEPLIWLEPQTISLIPGRVNDVKLPIENRGNVPLNLHATWLGFPSKEWVVFTDPLTLPIGGAADLSARITTPTQPEASRLEVRLVLKESPGDREMLAATIPVIISAPILKTAILNITQSGPHAAIYVVQVRNDGNVPATGVNVTLRRGSLVVDRVAFETVRPGAEHVANLVGPSGLEDLEIHVAADHDSSGFAVPLALEASNPTKRASLGALETLPAFMVLAFAAAYRRRQL